VGGHHHWVLWYGGPPVGNSVPSVDSHLFLPKGGFSNAVHTLVMDYQVDTVSYCASCQLLTIFWQHKEYKPGMIEVGRTRLWERLDIGMGARSYCRTIKVRHHLKPRVVAARCGNCLIRNLEGLAYIFHKTDHEVAV